MWRGDLCDHDVYRCIFCDIAARRKEKIKEPCVRDRAWLFAYWKIVGVTSVLASDVWYG